MVTAAVVIGITIVAVVLHTEWTIRQEIRQMQSRILGEVKMLESDVLAVRDVLTEASRLKSLKEKERIEPSGDTIPSKRTFLSVAARRSMAARELEEQRGQRRIAANTRAMEG